MVVDGCPFEMPSLNTSIAGLEHRIVYHVSHGVCSYLEWMRKTGYAIQDGVKLTETRLGERTIYSTLNCAASASLCKLR